MLAAAIGGKLRPQFYSDTYQFGDVPEAPRQVAAGYISLGIALAWVVSVVATIVAYPAQLVGPLVSVANAIGYFLVFRRIRLRLDPRRLLEWVLLLHMVCVGLVQLSHTGHVAPMVATLPVVAALGALYPAPRMRLTALVVGLAVVAFCLLSALGLVGPVPPGGTRRRSWRVRAQFSHLPASQP